MTTQAEYIERWKQALRVLQKMSKHEREKHFDMQCWGAKTDCGTVACLAGHCSLDSWFRKRGFRAGFTPLGALYFSGENPSDFFGEQGVGRVFLKLNASYSDVVKLTKQHIAYLKQGGEA
jgi:hypothetical protein